MAFVKELRQSPIMSGGELPPPHGGGGSDLRRKALCTLTERYSGLTTLTGDELKTLVEVQRRFAHKPGEEENMANDGGPPATADQGDGADASSSSGRPSGPDAFHADA